MIAFFVCFYASANINHNSATRFAARRLLEFCRTVPDIVFALIFVIAFGLGPMAGVLAVRQDDQSFINFPVGTADLAPFSCQIDWFPIPAPRG